MAKVICTYSGVSEHDMDMMFLQLFSIDEGFIRLFLDTAHYNAEKICVESVELSKTDARLGESDITVLLSVDSKKVALLIEDKIDAIDMPEQPERYIKRGKKAVNNRECEDFLCFIVCPQKYYDNNEAARKYPNVLTYEIIREYLSGKDSQLYFTYSQQINKAIDKAKRPPQVVLNEQANAFFRKYKDYQEAVFPSLDLRTNRNSNGYWAQYATRLGNVYLHHKIQEGKVDLTFSNASTRMSDVELIADWLRKHNINEARAVVAGKAGVIHVDVPKLNMTISFEDNDSYDISKCFEVITELIETAKIFSLAGELSQLS